MVAPDPVDPPAEDPALEVVVTTEGVVRIVNVAEGCGLVFSDKRVLEHLLTEVVATVLAPGYEPGEE